MTDVKYGVWVTAGRYHGMNEPVQVEPNDVDRDLAVLVRRAESLEREDGCSHFYAVLDSGYKDWWPLGHIHPGETLPSFHDRQRDTNPDSGQARRYVKRRQESRRRDHA